MVAELAFFVFWAPGRLSCLLAGLAGGFVPLGADAIPLVYLPSDVAVGGPVDAVGPAVLAVALDTDHTKVQRGTVV